MKPVDALITATRNGAIAAGLSDKIGVIGKGKYADLIVIKGNPINNIDVLLDTKNIVMVIKEGKIVKNLLEDGMGG